MAKHLNVALDFTANTSQAKNQIQELSNLLNRIAQGGPNIQVNVSSLKEAQAAAKELAFHLNKAYNPESGKIDLSSFNKSLKESGINITKLSQGLLQAGSTGQQAFVSLARSISQAEQPVLRVNGLLTEMWVTMKNTARWQITSSALHGLIGGLQSAIGYAKDLNKTLTDIRIVAPEKSMQDMYKFAELANQQAKELSSTTLDYAKGALIYYQQGLDDITTQERTDVTTKMANVTGDSVDEVSSYMTSIWNNFNKAGDESAEHFADILTKLGAETAASTTEITAALEKYTGVANTIGLSYESATAAATTLIDRLREQPEVAGTALKTIFARLEGLKLEGETNEGGTTTSLNKYSEALHKVGVEIKDANGEIREADDILIDIGEKWNSGELSKDVKIATAETVAGIRQWQQFAALMDNFDYFKQYKELAETGSEGALQEQQEIYAESWEAASNRVKSSIQSIYMDLLNDKAFIKILNVIADLTNGLDGFIDKIGGLKGVLLGVGSFALMGLKNRIEPALQNLANNISVLTGGAKSQYAKINQETISQINAIKDNSSLTKVQQQELVNSKQVLNFKSKLALVEKDLSTIEKERLNSTLADLEKEQEALVGIISKTEQLKNENKDLLAGDFNSSNAKLDKMSNSILKKYDKQLDSEWDDNVYNQSVKIIGTAERARENSGEAIRKIGAEFVKSSDKSLFGSNIFSGTIKDLEQLQIELSRLPKNIDMANSEIKNLQERFEILTAELPLTIKESKDFQKAISLIKKPQSLEDIQNGFRGVIKSISLTEISAKDFKQVLLSLGVPIKELKQFEQILKEVQAGEMSAEEAAERLAQGFDKIGRSTKHGVSGIEAISTAAAGLGQISMVIMSMNSIVETLQDPDVTGWEKFSTIAMSLSMLIPSLIGTFKSLGTVIDFVKIKTLALAKASGVAAVAEGGAATATNGLNIALTILSKNPVILWLSVLTAACLAVAGAMKYFYDKAHIARNEFEEASKKAEKASERYAEVTSSIENLNNTLDSIDDKKEAIEDMAAGTSEWTKAVNDLNNEVSDSINNFNDLNDNIQDVDAAKDKLNKELKDAGFKETNSLDLVYGEDYYYDSQGVETITEAGQIKIDTISEMSVDQANINVHAADAKMNFAENKSLREEMLEGTFGEGKQWKHSEDYDTGAKGVTTSKGRTYNTGSNKHKTEDKQQYTGTDSLSDSTYDAIIKGIQDNELTQSQMEDSVDLYDFLRNHGATADLAKNERDLIISNEDLRQALMDHAITMKENTEAVKGNFAADFNGDEDFIKGLRKETNETYGKGTYKEYGAGLIDAMSDNAARYNEFLLNEASAEKRNTVLYGNSTGKGWEKYKKSTASSLGKEESEITKEDVDNLLAYQVALEKTEKSQKAFIAAIKETKEAKEALKEIKKLTKDNEKAINAAKEAVASEGAWAHFLKSGSKASKEFSKYCEDIRDNLKTAFQINDDENNSILSKKFIAEHAEDIQDAINGDMEAFKRVQQALAEETLDVADIDFSINTEDALNNLTDLKSQMNAFLDKDYTVNANLETDAFMQSLFDLNKAGQLSTAELENILNSLDVEFEVGSFDVPFDSTNNTIDAESLTAKQKGVLGIADVDEEGRPIDLKQVPVDGAWHLDTTMTKKVGDKTMISVPYITQKGLKKGAPKVPTIGGGNRATRPQISGNPSGSGSGSRGSRGTARRGTRASRQKEKSVVKERYKEINDQLDKNSRASEKLAKIEDKLYGKDKLSQMDKVNKKHLKEIELLRTKAKEARQYYLNDRREAQKALDAALKIAKQKSKTLSKNIFSDKYLTKKQQKAIKKLNDLKFDSTGEINNYTQIMDALQDELNALERYYNNPYNFMPKDPKKRKAGADYKSRQEKFKTNKIDPLVDKIEALQAAIDQYDETRELIEDLKDQINDAYAEWQSANYEKLTYSLELKVTVNDNDLTFLEHKLNQVSDGIYKAAEMLDYYFSGSGDTKLNLATEAIKIQENNFKNLTKAYERGQITQADYIEGLKSSYDNLMSNVDALQNLKREMTDYYANTLNSAISELDQYNDRISATSSLLDHYKTILELTNRAADYDLIESLQAANAMAVTTSINTAKAQYDLASREFDRQNALYRRSRENYFNAESPEGLAKVRAKELKRINEEIAAGASGDVLNGLKKARDILMNGTDEAVRNMLLDQMNFEKAAADSALATQEETQEQMMANVETGLQLAGEQLETALQRAAKAVEDALTGIKGGFEEIMRQMDLTSTRQDEYLTKTNQTYELNKMQRTLAKDMDKTDSQAAKAKLANFSKELQALAERDELSNLELEIAQKKYELLKAQIALEESQNAKSTIRLSRDNEGNYGYVYVANEEQVEDAEQNVEDIKNDLYNLQLEATNNYGQKIVQVAQDYMNAIQEAGRERQETGDEEAYQERVAAIQRQFAPLFASMGDIQNVALYSTEELIEPLKEDAWIVRDYGDVIDHVKDNIGALDNYVINLNDSFDIFNNQIDNLTRYINFEDRMKNVLTTTEDTMNQISEDFQTTGEQVTKVLDEVASKLNDFGDATIPLINSMITSTDSIIEQIKNIIQQGAEGSIATSTAKFNELMVKLAGEKNADKIKYTSNDIAYTKKGLFGVTDSAEEWSANTIAKNEKTAAKLLTFFENGRQGFYGFNANGVLSYILGETNKDSKAVKKWIKKNKIQKAIKFDTGGYTGDWGPEDGKFAVLHEKELVLNQEDTRNILAAVDGARSLAAAGFLANLAPSGVSSGLSGHGFEQSVTIQAEFPSVTDRYEIESAFNNLVNRASQHAFNNRRK